MTNKLIKFLKKTGYVLSLMVGYTLAGIIFWSSVIYFSDDSVSLYEEEAVLDITGVQLPKYEVIDSWMEQVSTFDYEETGGANIEFEKLPDEKFFKVLDQMVETCNEDSVQFKGAWEKEGDQYRFSFLPMGVKTKFVREDGFFYLNIDKNSRKASMKFGNY